MRHHNIGRRPERLVALDIETVPDRERLPPDWGTKFAKPMFHQIACISFVEASIEIDQNGYERYQVTDCRSGGEADWDEERLLAEFWRFFARRPTRICGWNTRGFDMPVILQRSLLHGISAAPWFQARTRFEGYGYRYSDAWHADVMDLVADYGACAKLGLDEAAAACGLPGKMVAHGSEVEALVGAGKIAEVRAYCEIDTLNTMLLYFRHSLLTGRTDRRGYDDAVDGLAAHLEVQRVDRPHLGSFQDRLNERATETARKRQAEGDPRSALMIEMKSATALLGPGREPAAEVAT